MSLHENIVREFFEHHGFFVRSLRHYMRRGEEELELLVNNPQPKALSGPVPFVLAPGDVEGVSRAVVAIRPWHTETFSLARLAGTPEIFRFVQPSFLKRSAAAFGSEQPLWKILVLPALPAGKGQREAAVGYLKAKGIEAVLLFRTILADLADTVETNRNYQKSDLLQILRVLKNYDLLKDRQLELFKGRRR